MAELLENIRGFQACNYSSIGALTFTVHDWIASLEDEVEQIWKKPWSNLKLLYLSIRLLSLGTQLISTGLTLRLAKGSPSIRQCRVLAGFQGLASQLLMIVVQLILMLRVKPVQALFYERKFLNRVIRFLFLAEIALMTIIFIVGLPQLQFGVNCVITSFPGKVAAFFVTPILFEFLLFVLTMVKFYEAVRDGWGQEHIVTRFLKDGIWAFALPFTVLLINTFCLSLISGALSSVAYSWVIAIPGFAGCRLILNMSHLLRINHIMLPRTTEQAIMDTIITSNDNGSIEAEDNLYELISPERHCPT